jgi:hypothetical protein
LIIAHVNCHHLLPHIDWMRIRFGGSGVDVIGVNETFLTQSVSSKAVEIVGYRFLRNDKAVYGRPGKRWLQNHLRWVWSIFSLKLVSSHDFVGRICIQTPEY